MVRVNPAYDPARVTPPSDVARAFHRSLPGYAPTPLHDLGDGRLLKDESDRFGLPAFKILGASWAVERAVTPETERLIAASAGNHGRAVARAAKWRGLAARIYLPARALQKRRDAIASEGAEVVIVDGTYEDAVAAAEADADGLLIADVGASQPAHDVIDGYATLFDEIAECGMCGRDQLYVPVGVGSLAAAAARFGAARGVAVIGVEPEDAPCLTASLAAGEPVVVDTPGTMMAGMDCAEVSVAAWPDLLHGIAGTVLVSDAACAAAMAELEGRGILVGECGAAAWAANVPGVLIATEGRI